MQRTYPGSSQASFLLGCFIAALFSFWLRIRHFQMQMVQQLQQQQQPHQAVPQPPPPQLSHIDLSDPAVASKMMSIPDQQVMMQLLKSQPIILSGQQPQLLAQQPPHPPPG